MAGIAVFAQQLAADVRSSAGEGAGPLEREAGQPHCGNPRRRATAGFTIPEILAAIVVFGLLAAAFAALSLTTISANHGAHHVTAAASLARDKLEELRATDYAALVTGSDSSRLTESESTTGAGAIFTRGWTVVGGPTATTKEVTVTVSWSEGTTRTVTLRTLIGN